MPDRLSFVQALGHGIHAIDTGFHRPNFDAAFLIVENGRAAYVDAGTNHSVPRLLAALEALGLGRDAVDYVIPTHVHLDHAGGAGVLMRELPAARLVVHPRGARHLIDPARLVSSAVRVYGPEEVERSYGTIVGIDEARVQLSSDAMVLDFAGRPLTFLDTPGHARHHHCIWDARSRGFFTGDTFGLSYREFDTTARGAWVMPTSTPIQFDPPALRQSVERMMAFEPACMYLTHYSRVGRDARDVQRLAALLLGQVDEMVALALGLPDDAARHAALVGGLARIYLARLRAHGCTLTDAQILALIDLDLELNAQGLAIWLKRRLLQ